ncbi:hypothetical protein GCM10027076_31940 [Nocardioides montaniterrae]
MKALPDRLAGETLTSRADAGPQASYGDPAIVVSCGVGVPKEFGLGAQCEVANGVGWWLPNAQYSDQSLDATVYSPGYSPVVEVVIPARYRPGALAAAMAELAAPVRRLLTKNKSCV